MAKTYCCVCGREKIDGVYNDKECCRADQGMASHGYCPTHLKEAMEKILKEQEDEKKRKTSVQARNN